MKFGIDANFFKYFIDEHVVDELGSFAKCFTKVEDHGKIATDDDDYILHEWKECTGTHANEFAEEWIAEKLAQNVIVRTKSSGCPQTKREAKKLGMPKKDAKILSIYKDIGTDYILSEDIDFFCPQAKKLKNAQKQKIKAERTGPICKYAEKKIGIIICDCNYFLELELH